MTRSVELVVSGGTVRSAAGPVEAGSWVAILVSEDPEPYLVDSSAGKLPPLSRILLPKVQVLSVEASERSPQTVLTVAVTQAEADKVIGGSRNGDLTFALRPGSTGRGIAPQLFGSAS